MLKKNVIFPHRYDKNRRKQCQNNFFVPNLIVFSNIFSQNLLMCTSLFPNLFLIIIIIIF